MITENVLQNDSLNEFVLTIDEFIGPLRALSVSGDHAAHALGDRFASLLAALRCGSRARAAKDGIVKTESVKTLKKIMMKYEIFYESKF